MSNFMRRREYKIANALFTLCDIKLHTISLMEYKFTVKRELCALRMTLWDVFYSFVLLLFSFAQNSFSNFCSSYVDSNSSVDKDHN